MTKSTFAGKSTDDTIRNYAEMLIDDLTSNSPERAVGHWEKAREIDNKSAKRIFGEEYSSRIGKAYYNCVVNYQESELISLTKESDDFGILEKMKAAAGNLALIQVDVEKFGELDKKVTTKFDYIMSLLNQGLLICPQSANLNYVAAKILIFRMTSGEIPIGWILQPRKEWRRKGKIIEGLYENFKREAEKFIDTALRIKPNHPEALKAKETMALMEVVAKEQDIENKKREQKSASGCFIATAAYGTPFSEEIDVLRNWRDDFLEASYPGRLFIRTYYSLSPPVADNISESDGKRKIVRIALGPIVKVLKGRYSYEN